MMRRAGKVCEIDKCGREILSRSMCAKHYARWLAHGDPTVVMVKQSPAGAPMAFIDSLPQEGRECIPWPYSKNNQGYAQIQSGPKGKISLVSRIVCERHRGPPPSPLHHAAHSCGKGHTGCVAPYHLSWKSPKENQADRYIHGTMIVGSQSPNAKITEADIPIIRALAGRLTQKKIGKMYGLTQTNIGKILRRKTWAHVP